MLRIVATRALTTTVVRQMDPIQAIFINKIRQYAADSAAAGGPGNFVEIVKWPDKLLDITLVIAQWVDMNA